MKQQLKNFVKSASRAVQSDALTLQAAINKENQILLGLQYRAAAEAKRPLSFADVGFSLYSDTDEDGILLYIFSVIGMKHRTVVDIGAAGIMGSNSANLLTNHGFTGLLMDGNAAGIEVMKEFYATNHGSRYQPPLCKAEMVTRDNVNQLITGNGISGEIDLLCIDIDGNDYWIFDAINAVTPRVVIIEFQDILGPERAWTIPYKPDFDYTAYDVNREHRNYVGASLRAMTKAAERKGMRLVGTNRGGWNAFFVRNGEGDDVLPARTPEECFGSQWNRWGVEHRFPLVANMEWVEV